MKKVDSISIRCFADKDGKIVKAYGTFETTQVPTGRRVKHYVFPDEKAGFGYWHVCRFLIDADEVTDEEAEKITDVFVSRAFWGKVRLVEQSEIYLTETWNAIDEIIKTLEK